MIKRILLIGVGAAAVGVILLTIIALLMQNNPPVKNEPAWNSPQTRALAQRACFDCHSNETQWPWYDKLPVGSWIAVFDTVRGRRHLNFSEWNGTRGGGEREGGEDDMAEVIQRGEMPPELYTMIHPEAVLSDVEKQQLIDGLQQSLR